MKMIRRLTITAALVIGVLAGLATLRSQQMPRIGYAITSERKSFDRVSHAVVRSSTEVLLASSNGATMRYTVGDGFREGIDPIQRQVILYDDRIQQYGTQPLSAESVRRRTSPAPKTCAEAFRGAPCMDGPRILGFSTKIVDASPKGEGHQVRFWVSPELAWAQLRVEFRGADGSLSETVDAVNIQIGEPEAGVMNASGYSEQSAAELMRNGIGARGGAVSEQTLEEVRKRDAMKRENIIASYGLSGKIKLAWIRLLGWVG